MWDALVICGPTASGKTRLGVELALRLDGEILSADSRQVYRGLDLGAGKDLDEYRTPRGAVRCHLLDLVAPTEVYTVWRYLADFAAAYRTVRAHGRLPVVVGGTGLYLEAVLRGYRIPDCPPDPALRARLEALPAPELAAMLADLDPQLCARTDTRNRRRMVRAMEVAASARSGGAGRLAAGPAPELPALAGRRCLVVGIRLERGLLRARIAARLRDRLERGLVAEVEALLAGGVPAGRLHQLGMEYRHVARYLAGAVDYGCMRAELERDIGRLAKRQCTYFRGMERRGVRLRWIDGADLGAAADAVEQLVRAGPGGAPAAGQDGPGQAAGDAPEEDA